MTHHSRLCAGARSLIALTAFHAFLPACHMTETTTSVRAQSQAPIERIRLERSDAGPVSGAWRQDGTVLVGQLVSTNACATETRQRTKWFGLPDPPPNRRSAAGAYIAGTAFSVLGLGLF